MKDSACTYAAVFAGGALGAWLRAFALLPMSYQDGLWGICACNAAGSAIYAVAAELYFAKDSRMKELTTAGFCGGLTTFSTVCKDSVELMQNGNPEIAAGIFAVNILASVAAVFLFGGLAAKFREAVFKSEY